MKPTLKKLQNKADKLWRTIGKDNASCEVCDTLPKEGRINYTQLHPHHIEGRRNKTLRWDLRNRCWLCAYHHNLGLLSAEGSPLWFIGWLMRHRKEDYEYLMKKRNEISKFKIKDMEEIIEGLEKE